ncbi:LysE family transporter [Streptomyces sp. SPB4]|uniref:LysE family transporter n=1 Tax=Streptomyces sp. SPB4 TaxID=2940553 RepID=UPI002474E49A|nr:LysE family transporter [Streptomyces sp. SPB4]MDH6542085.1 threonine/homoserine/homoserine lactone efflux protein [Streptomyces sp. SPB4]
MSELFSPALSGAVAGLGVAMPMGAMSVLLLQEAMRHRRTAVAAAAGIAAVDLGYAALATAVGPWVASRVSPVEAWIRLLAAAVLLSIAAHALLRSARPVTAPPPSGDRLPGDGIGDGIGGGSGSGAVRAFGRYVGLTAVNPTTALYFAALTTAQASALTTPATAGAFLVGVAAASLLWQQTLVVLGALAGRRISPAARAWTFRLGYGLVAAYALKIAFPLPHLA